MLEDEKCVTLLIIPNLDKVIEMIAENIFRPLPCLNKTELEKEDTGIEQEDVKDPAWPCLQGIYQLLYDLISCNLIEEKLLKKFITSKFIQQLLELFDSEDETEREYLKNVLHRLYSKVSILS